MLLFAALCLSLLLPSCSGDETLLPVTGGKCRATLALNVSSFGQEGGGKSRSVAGNADEDLVRDLWVFQFCKQTGIQLKDPVYISESQLNGNTDEIAIDFTQNGQDESSVICVVANTHDATWAVDDLGTTRTVFQTYEGLLQQALPDSVSQPFLSSNMGETGGYTIPMFGESAELVIASKAYISVALVRMFARVHVLVDPSYPYANHMSIKRITYSNVPFYAQVKEITRTAEYPADVQWKEYVEEGANEYIFYMPENRQGVVSDMTDKLTADPTSFPEKALAIKIDMVHTPMAEDEDTDSHVHEYTVYPGGDMKNDFNIKRNCIYNVIIKLVSEPGKDTILP